jgi:DNA-binding response OmpR family regulator
MTDTPQSTWYVFDQQTRILVVDDDPILREFASVYLTTPLSEVVLAPDASTALDLLAREQFDIALLDVDMPGMNGFELLESMRGQQSLRNLPVVMVTGRDDIASIDRAYAAGATSFVTKPANWRQISYHLHFVVRATKNQSATPLAQDTRSAEFSSAAWMSVGRRREFATALGAIINAAARIADGRDSNEEGAQKIIATAEALLLKAVLSQDAEGRALKFLRPTQQSLPHAS